jgi:hypothetical protein
MRGGQRAVQNRGNKTVTNAAGGLAGRGAAVAELAVGVFSAGATLQALVSVLCQAREKVNKR